MTVAQRKKRWMPSAESLLTRGEVGVLRMIAEGVTDREIADELDVAKKVVEQCRRRLYEKTGAKNRVQLTRYAVSVGLVPREWPTGIEAKGESAAAAKTAGERPEPN